MTQATSKRDGARTDSVAFQYLREQVEQQMAGVYRAFGMEAAPAKATGTAKPTPPSDAGKSKTK